MSVAAESLSMLGPMNRPELLRPDEMAVLLRISRSTLDRWSHQPGFPVLRQPHLVLYPWRKVMEYVERIAVERGQLPSRSDEKPKRKPKK